MFEAGHRREREREKKDRKTNTRNNEKNVYKLEDHTHKHALNKTSLNRKEGS